MENEVFERDYTNLPPLHLTQQLQQDFTFLKQAKDSGIISKYEDAIKAMPKYIDPRKKAEYDDLLTRLDELSMEARGTIRGVVDYEKWQASITLNLPILRFIEPVGTLLMADIALLSDCVTISTDSNSNIQLDIVIPYFSNIGNVK